MDEVGDGLCLARLGARLRAQLHRPGVDVVATIIAQPKQLLSEGHSQAEFAWLEVDPCLLDRRVRHMQGIAELHVPSRASCSPGPHQAHQHSIERGGNPDSICTDGPPAL